MSALVTGVQTCALPISGADAGAVAERSAVELSGADRTDPGDSVFAAPSLSGVGVGVQPARQCLDRRRRRHRAAGGTEPAVPLSVLSRSEEHTSELQSLMRISYAVFCLKKKNNYNNKQKEHHLPVDIRSI